MKSFTLCSLRLAILSLVLPSIALQAAELPIIAKARAYLGSEAALDAVNSLHYYGQLDIGGLDEETAKMPITVEIIFQRPYRQLSVIKSAKGTEITVLDGYEAWQRVVAPNDESRWNLELLKIPQIKNLRANVWENMSFFRGLDSAGGEVQDLGAATIDGVACRKLAFVHSPEIVFYRYFDEANGRLVLTQTGRGENIREEGSIVSGGIKFPKVLTTVSPREDGSLQTIVIRFDRVEVNGNVDPATFEMPLLISK